MKYINIIFFVFTEIVLLVNSEKNDKKFLPNLPVGEFRINYKAIVKCNSNPNSVIQQNFYFSKISTNVTQLKGNLTFKKTFDDSFRIHFNLAVKDSIGGWKDNAHVFSAPKACSSLKNYLGPFWNKFCSILGFNSTDCPIQPGVYSVKDFALYDTIYGTNFPRSFFYGTYKVRFFFSDNLKHQHGCLAYVVELKRPWELE